MASIDSINTIIKRIKSDVKIKLPNTSQLLRNSVLMILIESVSGVFYSLQKGLQIVKRDSSVLTANSDRLDEFGNLWGVTRKALTKTTATFKVYTADATISSGVIFSDDSGYEYASVGVTVIGSGFGLVEVESVLEGYIVTPISIFEPSGTDYNNIEVSNFIAGQPEEVDSEYKIRILNRIKYKASGGNASDYEAWLLELPNVTKAFVIPNRTAYGEVLLSYLIDGLIPDVAFDDQYIKDAINAKKPLTANIRIGKPIPKVINLEIKLRSVIGVDPTQNRSDVLLELAEVFKEHAMRDTVFYKSYLSEAIIKVVGVDSHNIILPSSDVIIDEFEIAEIGTVTWV